MKKIKSLHFIFEMVIIILIEQTFIFKKGAELQKKISKPE